MVAAPSAHGRSDFTRNIEYTPAVQVRARDCSKFTEPRLTSRDSWPVTALPIETLLSHFSADIPRHIAEHTLQVFTAGDGDTRALNATRVTQFFARQILRQKKVRRQHSTKYGN